MQKITPFLWFDGQAEEAMNYYVSVFKDAEILDITRFGDGAPYPSGTAMSVRFRLHNQEFMGFNAGPEFHFTEAISFYVDCKNQEEVDELWEKLSEKGEKGQCGWLKDKFGLSWQIIPQSLGQMLNNPDPERAGRVMEAMLQMSKIDTETLREAAEGK